MESQDIDYFSTLPLEMQSKILSKTELYPHTIRNLTPSLREYSIKDFYSHQCMNIPLSNKELSNIFTLKDIPINISIMGIDSFGECILTVLSLQKINKDNSINCLLTKIETRQNEFVTSQSSVNLEKIESAFDVVNIITRENQPKDIFYNYFMIFHGAINRITCSDFHSQYPYEFTNNYIKNTINYLLQFCFLRSKIAILTSLGSQNRTII